MKKLQMCEIRQEQQTSTWNKNTRLEEEKIK